MTRTCSAPGCTKRHADKSKYGDKLSFHSFPLGDKKLLKKWVYATGRHDRGRPWKPTRSSLLCSDHFAEDDFVPCLHVRKLREGSVPSWFKHRKEKRTTYSRPPPMKRIMISTPGQRTAGQAVPPPTATEEPRWTGASPSPVYVEEPRWTGASPSPVYVEEPSWTGASPPPPPAEESCWPEESPSPPPAEEPCWPGARPSPPPAEEPCGRGARPSPPLAEEPCGRGARPPPPPAEEPCWPGESPSPPPAEEPCWPGESPSPPPAEEPCWPGESPSPPPADEPCGHGACPSPQLDVDPWAPDVVDPLALDVVDPLALDVVDPLAVDVTPTMEHGDHNYGMAPKRRNIYSHLKQLTERCRKLCYERKLLIQKLKRRDQMLRCMQATLDALKKDS